VADLSWVLKRLGPGYGIAHNHAKPYGVIF
jgi:hypothetical protein